MRLCRNLKSRTFGFEDNPICYLGFVLNRIIIFLFVFGLIRIV